MQFAPAAQKGGMRMDTNSIYSIVDLIIGAGGLYVIYLTVTMMKTGKLKQNGLLPKDLDIEKCKDTAGYINFMGPRQMGFGILALFCGIIGLIHDFTGMIGGIVYLICIILMVIYIIFYSLQAKKAVQMFW